MLCALTGCSCCTLLYAAHSSLWITEPVRTCCWTMGSRVWAERLGTIHMTPRAGEWLVSQSPHLSRCGSTTVVFWIVAEQTLVYLHDYSLATKHHRRVMVEEPPAAQITTVRGEHCHVLLDPWSLSVGCPNSHVHTVWVCHSECVHAE